MLSRIDIKLRTIVNEPLKAEFARLLESSLEQTRAWLGAKDQTSKGRKSR